MFTKKIMTAAAVAISAISFASTASSATVTTFFSTFLTGTDVGNSSLATLVAEDVAGGVEMTLTNTGTAAGVSSFDTQLFLAYAAPNDSSVGLTHISGVQTKNFVTNAGNITNAGYSWQMLVEWGTSNNNNGAARLEIGESSKFLLTGATTARLFGNSGSNPYAMIHIQGVGDNANLSSKYGPGDNGGGGITPVPLPASLPLLLGALGLGGFALKRRQRSA